MSIGTAGTLSLVLLLACQRAGTSQDPNRDARLLAPSSSAAIARIPLDSSKDRAVQICVEQIQADQPAEAPVERGRRLAQACGALFAERGCSDAYKQAWEHFDPSQRIRIMVEGCRDAYCPTLAVPRPTLCESGTFVIEAAADWPEFLRVILVRDLGEERAGRVLHAMKDSKKR
jgi:hypothetical protein